MKEFLLFASLLLCIVLSVQNTSRVTLHVLFLRFRLQEGLLILIFLMIGFILGLLFSRGKK